MRYAVSTEAPAGTTITVSPTRFAVSAGQSHTIDITIATTQTSGTFFGAINLVPQGGEVPMHIPVAFVAGQGDVSLASTCDAASIPRNTTTTCDVTAVNNGAAEATVDLTTTVSNNLGITGVTGADQVNSHTSMLEDVVLAGAAPGVPPSTRGRRFGFLPPGCSGYPDRHR